MNMNATKSDVREQNYKEQLVLLTMLSLASKNPTAIIPYLLMPKPQKEGFQR